MEESDSEKFSNITPKMEDNTPEEISFKIRFNTAHGDTGLYWRIIINEREYLAKSIQCSVPTFSESSFDRVAGAIKYHLAGKCTEFYVDELKNAYFK